jgi:hypothetical protein
MNFAGIGFSGKTQSQTLSTVTAFVEAARSRNCKLPSTQSGITLKSKIAESQDHPPACPPTAVHNPAT